MTTKLMYSYKKMPTNFMTPNVLNVEQCGERIVELSQGQGMDGEKIYGVSEFEKAKTLYGLNTTGRSKVFFNRIQAESYYKALTQ